MTGGTISNGGVGVEYQDKEKEGITHNTVVGNVEIGTSSGDEINRDLNNMQETTKDKDSGYYNTFVESGVLALTTEKGREDFKESVQLAGEEIAAVGRVVDTAINKQEDDKRNPIGVLGEERQAEKWRNEGLVEDFKNAKSQEEMAEAIEKIGAKEGYEVEVIYSDSSSKESLDGKKGEAYIDGSGKIVIVINTEAEGIGNKDVLAGVLAEELSHGINYANGKDKGNGTETLAGHSNDYFTGKLGDSSTSLSLTGDGKDYNNVDFGVHVGDKVVLNDPVKSNGKRDSDSTVGGAILTTVNNSNLLTNDQKSELRERINNKELISYNEMTEDEKKYFIGYFQTDNIDKITTKIDKDGKEVLVYTRGDLNKANEYEKDKTLKVRELIDNPISVYYQVPSREQIESLGTDIEKFAYLTSDNKAPVVVFYNPTSERETKYISGLTINSQTGKGGVQEQIMDKYSAEGHELLIHPLDFMEYKVKGDITYANKSDVIEHPRNDPNRPLDNIVYFKDNVQTLEFNGEKYYVLVPTLKFEANTLEYEKLTRDYNNPNGENTRILYHESLMRYMQKFNTMEQVNNFFNQNKK